VFQAIRTVHHHATPHIAFDSQTSYAVVFRCLWLRSMKIIEAFWPAAQQRRRIRKLYAPGTRQIDYWFDTHDAAQIL